MYQLRRVYGLISRLSDIYRLVTEQAREAIAEVQLVLEQREVERLIDTKQERLVVVRFVGFVVAVPVVHAWVVKLAKRRCLILGRMPKQHLLVMVAGVGVVDANAVVGTPPTR